MAATGKAAAGAAPAAADLASACRSRLEAALRRLWTEDWGLDTSEAACKRVALVLSGGVDTCAVAEALRALGVKPALALTVLVGDAATDRPYCRALAAQHGFNHVEIELTPDQLLADPLDFGVRVLGTFDGMELRNSCVVARALLEAKKLGAEFVLTGDGSDELLGGYSFTHAAEDPEWTKKRNDMCARWFFSAPAMGDALGMRVASPFTHDEFASWALTLDKAACIAERMLETYPGEAKILKRTGKVPLREAYPEAISAWRRKDPIEVGSGSTVLGKDEGKFFEERIPLAEFAEDKQRAAHELAVVIRNPEHLFYFRAFQREFPNAFVQAAYAAGPAHEALPDRRFDASSRVTEEDACVGCGFQLRPNGNFCKVCGAWPARRQSTAAALHP